MYLPVQMPGQSFSFFLTTVLKDCTVSFTKHDAPFRTTEKCGARWPTHTIILKDITVTETRQTWQTWWLCPALLANGKLPYSSIDFYTANLFLALSYIGVCAYCLCCQVFVPVKLLLLPIPRTSYYKFSIRTSLLIFLARAETKQ